MMTPIDRCWVLLCASAAGSLASGSLPLQVIGAITFTILAGLMLIETLINRRVSK